MRKSITVRLTDDLANWLSLTAQRAGVPQGRIVQEQLERAKRSEKRGFLKLAGSVAGPPDLSQTKAFAESHSRQPNT